MQRVNQVPRRHGFCNKRGVFGCDAATAEVHGQACSRSSCVAVPCDCENEVYVQRRQAVTVTMLQVGCEFAWSYQAASRTRLDVRHFPIVSLVQAMSVHPFKDGTFSERGCSCNPEREQTVHTSIQSTNTRRQTQPQSTTATLSQRNSLG
jgi:hypothetical protein